ncbi:MAG: hypothetical protein K9H49_16460 [Bacteroidales bacterium]|nr:hypothetical protein [Bacteroidales bacterium]MCF8390584.1 hypothetical protein [Bacteroidales bacterium]
MNIKLSYVSFFLSVLLFASFSLQSTAKAKPETSKNDSLKSSTFSGLKFRNIGPAFTSGRIADFAVNPDNHSEYYVAVASGSVWKTINNGTTFTPIFDKYGSYSTGVIEMDPTNHNVLWLGTGENNHQRALGYGDGVYKSLDGGKNWENMGLKESRQIGGIVIDPKNSDIVLVAAEGSVWGPGGDRGIYKTKDGGKTWKKTLDISENTGANNIIMDPADNNVLYATTEQRRRHVYSKIGGGPESAVYKSADKGESWRKITKGLPSGDLGGMGIDISPVDNNVLYLIVEAGEGNSGFYRSSDRGESWQKMSSYSSSGQYYNEIFCDPVDVNKVYSTETVSQVSVDGGKTWTALGLEGRHVDDHALWIDPKDTNHIMIGGDGGVYETYDSGSNWIFKSNLSVTQFYRVQVDNDYPFYNVYGGTQDNNTLGGPSQNTCSEGVSNEDWKAILGGDGFWAQIDPSDPNIVYCESQYGNMARYDKKSGETLRIKPIPEKGEKSYKWNWNTPLIISPHSNTRLYTFANKVLRSDDRGESWKVISGDLTSQVDRNTWPVMDHFWSIDAVAKDVSTSLWGTGVSLDESPVQEDLLFAGTDDGVISITENGGKSWRQIRHIDGVPDFSYVSDIMPSKFDANVVYVSFDNHKRDDFKPYVFKSTDKGLTWTPVANNLPARGTVHTLQQDHVNQNLLFAGTEFGVFFSIDGGAEWVKLSSGIPTIAIKDISIQERENDLVLASFGRGFFILDDYTPLRELADNRDILKKEAHIFSIKDALMYLQTGAKYGQGAALFYAENPDFGASFTYYLKDTPKTLKQQRTEKEKKLFEDKKPIPQPGQDELLKEQNEDSPYLLFTIMDLQGNVIRKITSKPSKGINRVVWDLRYDSPMPVRMREVKFTPVAGAQSGSGRGRSGGGGMLATPGKYKVKMDMIVRDELLPLSEAVEFEAKMLNNATLERDDRDEVLAFSGKLSDLVRVMRGAQQLTEDDLEKVIKMRQTVLVSSNGTIEMMSELKKMELELKDILFAFDGPEAKASWEELDRIDMPLNSRLNSVLYSSWGSTHGVTGSMEEGYKIIIEEFPPVLEKIKELNGKINDFQSKLDMEKIQWTPDRVPQLQ